jgi:Tfp pilus assembly protein PilF
MTDLQHRDQAVASADDQGAVQQGPSSSSDGVSVPVSAEWPRYHLLAVCSFLLLAVALVFGQTGGYPSINYDDSLYVYDNPHILGGLTTQGVTWVFTHSHGSNWHPLTGLSHILDCQLYGPNAHGHHVTNVVLHAATAILLFLVLWRMTGALWRSALVAAIFAIHPLRAESVAWISERKDVLSGLFFVLTLGGYVWYVRSPFSLRRYVLLMVVFALGLMSKAILVTVPFVLLLLDYWPLSRMTRATSEDTPTDRNGPSGRFSIPIHLVVEKLPLLLMTVVFCLVTLWAQSDALTTSEHLPLRWRLGNALVSCVAYLGKLFYPVGLAVFYPHSVGSLPAWKVAGAAMALVCISAGAIFFWRRYPYWLVGWLWYVGMLAPVIGIVQVGAQAMADRYTYLPQIGLYVALAWGAADVCRFWPHRRWLYAVTSILVLVALMAGAWRQTSFWHDSKALWDHALACTSRNDVAHNSLGMVLVGMGRLDEAMDQYRKALEIAPDDVDVHNNLGNALISVDRLDEAMAQFRRAVAIDPHDAQAHNNLGSLLARRGQFDAATVQFERALEIKPDYAEAHHNFGSVLARGGQFDAAVVHFQRALEIKPDDAAAHNSLGNALACLGRLDEAMLHYRLALETKPDFADAHNNLANALDTCGKVDEALKHYQKALGIEPDHVNAHIGLARLRASCAQAVMRNGVEAIEHAQRANQLSGGRRPDVLDTLAAAYAEAGWFAEAEAIARQALQLATQQSNQGLANALRSRLALYEAGKPYHQTGPGSTPRMPKP